MEVQSMQPLLQKVLVVMDEASDTFAGSIIVKPESVKEDQKPWSGVIVGFGEGRKKLDGSFDPVLDLRVGQRVLFNSWVGYKVPPFGDNKSELRMLEYKDILCEVGAGVEVS